MTLEWSERGLNITIDLRHTSKLLDCLVAAAKLEENFAQSHGAVVDFHALMEAAGRSSWSRGFCQDLLDNEAATALPFTLKADVLQNGLLPRFGLSVTAIFSISPFQLKAFPAKDAKATQSE